MIGPSFPAVLAAAQRGDEQAFAVLWRELQPAVLRYLRVAAPEVAEDLAADTWVSLIRGLARFRGDEQGFRALVFTAARHRALDWRRQSSRRQAASVPVEDLYDRPAPDDPAEAVLEAQSTRAALALIAELPPNQAEVVTLRMVAGLDVAQVASIVGKRPGAVRTLTHRGRRRGRWRLPRASAAGSRPQARQPRWRWRHARPKRRRHDSRGGRRARQRHRHRAGRLRARQGRALPRMAVRPGRGARQARGLDRVPRPRRRGRRRRQDRRLLPGHHARRLGRPRARAELASDPPPGRGSGQGNGGPPPTSG